MTLIWSRLRVIWEYSLQRRFQLGDALDMSTGYGRLGAKGDGFDCDRLLVSIWIVLSIVSGALNLGHRSHNRLHALLIVFSRILSGTDGTLYPSVRHTLPNLFPLDPINDPFYLFSTTVHSFASLSSEHGTATGGVDQRTSVLDIFPLKSLTR